MSWCACYSLPRRSYIQSIPVRHRTIADFKESIFRGALIICQNQQKLFQNYSWELMPLISDIEPIIDYCLFENVPKEQSRTYQNLFIVFGKAYADQFTYERGAHYDNILAPDTKLG